MCLAIPACIVELRPNKRALVELGGVKREISVRLLDDINVGDYVIVHVGHAISRISEEEAKMTLEIMNSGLFDIEKSKLP